MSWWSKMIEVFEFRAHVDNSTCHVEHPSLCLFTSNSWEILMCDEMYRGKETS